MLFLKVDAYDAKTGRTRKTFVNANHICGMIPHTNVTPPMQGTLLLVMVPPGSIMVKNSLEDIEKVLVEKGYLFEIPTMSDTNTLDGEINVLQMP